jgi:hypothetical protein
MNPSSPQPPENDVIFIDRMQTDQYTRVNHG